jgi:hypothetical protein
MNFIWGYGYIPLCAYDERSLPHLDLKLNACCLVKERNPGSGVQEGEVGMKGTVYR